jgi:hypothetical protein
MPYLTNPRRQNPIAFGTRRRGWDGPVRNGNRLFTGMGGLADGIPSSAGPNPASLYAPPNPQLVQSPFPSNPLNFASPQSAITAGLDPATVNTAWSKYINSFPSVQAAINGGVAPGVVTDLWNGGAPPAAPVPWYKKYAVLLIAGGGAVLLALAGKGEAR